MFDDEKEKFEIDFSKLEEIKNDKPSREFMKEINIPSSGTSNFNYADNSIFMQEIDSDIAKFNTSLTATQVKEVAEIIKKHNNRQKPIFLHHSKAKNIVKEDRLSEEYKKYEDVSNELLLDKKMYCIWSKHGQTRFSERVETQYSPLEKSNIEKYIFDMFKFNSLNDGQEYELNYRNSNVHTFKIVCFKNGQYVIIKTLYRIDKESKISYREETNKHTKNIKNNWK